MSKASFPKIQPRNVRFKVRFLAARSRERSGAGGTQGSRPGLDTVPASAWRGCAAGGQGASGSMVPARRPMGEPPGRRACARPARGGAPAHTANFAGEGARATRVRQSGSGVGSQETQGPSTWRASVSRASLGMTWMVFLRVAARAPAAHNVTICGRRRRGSGWERQPGFPCLRRRRARGDSSYWPRARCARCRRRRGRDRGETAPVPWRRFP